MQLRRHLRVRVCQEEIAGEGGEGRQHGVGKVVAGQPAVASDVDWGEEVGRCGEGWVQSEAGLVDADTDVGRQSFEGGNPLFRR